MSSEQDRAWDDLDEHEQYAIVEEAVSDAVIALDLGKIGKTTQHAEAYYAGYHADGRVYPIRAYVDADQEVYAVPASRAELREAVETYGLAFDVDIPDHVRDAIERHKREVTGGE